MLRTALRIAGLSVVVGALSCSVSPYGLEPGGAGAGQAPGAGPGPVEPTAAPTTVTRAHDVQAKHLVVGVLFAHSVTAKGGTIATSGPPLAPADLNAQLGPQDLAAPELTLDVLYAHDVKANAIVVREVHATDVNVGRQDDGAD